ncbi:fumarylacetoacetate hydrolase family protein [Paenibacillus sp. GCM10027629]|uniref:fumarylacetoacetate hydrolase family protein n=1 Tax=Paenibacillus sp. GCM10027629 TaxID=3273414 RepID=UPI003632A643
MKLLILNNEGKSRVGVKQEDGIRLVDATLQDILNRGLDGLADLETEGEALNEEFLDFAPCIPLDRKVICVGLNYRNHAKEAGLPVPSSPVLFNKFSNALTGHGKKVKLPEVTTQVDYEAELGIVIGKPAKDVTREEALDFVFGYCCINDLSARDLQNRTSQWLLGKSLDGFCPTGPYLVTADEVGNPNGLGIRCYVNGELRQNSNTKDMIFYVDEIVSYISRHISLEPGDLILTGTPEGVMFGYPDDRKEWLKPGDMVTVEVDKLGRLCNELV